MRIAVLWKGWSGYLEAFLAALGAQPDVELLVATTPPDPVAPYRTVYRARAIRVTASDEVRLRRAIRDFEPDVVLVCGWDVGVFRSIARREHGRAVRLLFFDNQWLRTSKQRLGIIAAPLLIWPRFDGAIVPGERQVEFALRLGFSSAEIATGGYSADVAQFQPAPGSGGGFIFLGRLVPEKGVDTLLDAYADYRSKTVAPWDLRIVGDGPLADQVANTAGVRFLGFVQPDDLPRVLSGSRCLVLPSRFEPWGVVVHEAVSAGIFVIASDAVGAADDLLCDGVNGRRVPVGDIEALSAAMSWVSSRSRDEYLQGAEVSVSLARTFSPTRWATEVLGLAQRVATSPSTIPVRRHGVSQWLKQPLRALGHRSRRPRPRGRGGSARVSAAASAHTSKR